MDESDKSYFSENCCEEYTAECDFPGIADYGNGMFLKLRDCGISGTANSDFGQDSMDSWDIYIRYAQFYDLIQFSSLKKQFTSNIIDVQLYSLCSNDIKALSEALMQNVHVTNLKLTGNELGTAGCSYLSVLLKENHVIQHLDLSRCKIDSVGAAELATALEKSKLRSLNLSYNKLECAGIQSILESLQTNTCLKELDISDNGRIRSECVVDISMFLEMNEKLEKLNLSGNYLNKETDLTRLMRTLEVLNETLQVLILQWNGISGENCANIFKNLIVKTETLKILDLSWNNFRNIGEILGLGIKKSTTLEHLDISHNPLTTEDIVMVLNSIMEPTSIRCLRISHVFVDEHLEKVISNAQLRIPNLNVIVALYTGIRKSPVDFQTLYLQRIHFLGVIKPKKKSSKVDIGHMLLNMKSEGNLEPMKKAVFISTFGKLKIVDSEEVIQDMAKVFQDSNKKVNVALMLDKYLELYPDTSI